MFKTPTLEDHLIRACLLENYGITATTLEFHSLGADINALVYHVLGDDGTWYFLKTKPWPLAEAGYVVSHYLNQHGVQAVLAPIPTKQGELWTRLTDHALILYPLIDGDNGWKRGMKDHNWKDLGTALKQMHGVELPPDLQKAVRKETFIARECIGAAEYDTQLPNREGKNEAERFVISRWNTHRQNIQTMISYMQTLGPILAANHGPFVVCHADMHPGNLLIDHEDRMHLIDWDDVKLATKERDFIFVPKLAVSNPDLQSPFFQGYGATDIDWVALTYYLCERTVQDIYEYARAVFFMDNLAEETRMDNAKGFSIAAGPDGSLGWAFAAAKHLPPGIIVG